MFFSKKLSKQNNIFLRHGFINYKNNNKKICVKINDKRYEFDFVTNFTYEIEGENLKFAIAMHWDKKKILFVNKDYIFEINDGSTSPYRTYYEGLMKKPFKFCYPLDDDVIIQISRNKRIIFSVEDRRIL